MSAKDIFHQSVKIALENDGWTISHDPYILDTSVFSRKLFIDIGAEKLLAAEKNTEKIVVEVKSFVGQSLIYDFYSVLGQMISYQIGLTIQEPERVLFLAIPAFIYQEMQTEAIYHLALQQQNIHFLVFDTQTNQIILWQK